MSAVPPHRINIYQKPRQGVAFIDSYRVTNYKHRLTYHGTYDSATCNLVVGQMEAERVFRDFIGSAISVYVDDPMEPIFDGYINAIIYEVGGIVFRRSLDEMANRVRVTYFNADSPAAVKTEQTAVINNPNSQAIYGIKEANLDAGVHYNNADFTHKTDLRDTVLGVMAWPQVSVSSRAGGGTMVTLEIKGFYHMFGWDVYQRTDNLTNPASNLILNAGPGNNRPANTDFFIEVVGTTGFGDLIIPNSAFNISFNGKTGQTYLQMLLSVVEAGDGVNEWVWGITHRDFNRTSTTQRRMYYRAANTVIEYTAKALRDTGVIFDIFGRRVDPWRVKPDAGIRITDVLVGYDQSGDNPSESYLKFIEYDAEAQSVSWQSSDDATLEGAFQLRKYFRRHGQRFGAPVRTMV